MVVTRDLPAAELFRASTSRHRQTLCQITLPDIDDFRIRRPQRFVLEACRWCCPVSP
ncbi:hypothetical protein KCP69_19065 [Salmonella enterica subsp. enterica]|nr:hypothetical protein KCP69_19065 [Salmonella enterica subsp. enterica]